MHGEGLSEGGNLLTLHVPPVPWESDDKLLVLQTFTNALPTFP